MPTPLGMQSASMASFDGVWAEIAGDRPADGKLRGAGLATPFIGG
jgi:hypothetical protein